jgi:hypothetical protein
MAIIKLQRKQEERKVRKMQEVSNPKENKARDESKVECLVCVRARPLIER